MDNTAGGWIQTHSGRVFYPGALQSDDICIEDVAHHLSLTCRFAGAVQEFYSVAQHAIHVSQVCELIDQASALWGLLHDASEAYLGDVTTPLKHAPWMAGYREHEMALQAAIYGRFGLTGPPPASVRMADRRMLVTEMRDLLPGPARWVRFNVEPMSFTVLPWPPPIAEARFLARFDTLMAGRVRSAGEAHQRAPVP